MWVRIYEGVLLVMRGHGGGGGGGGGGAVCI